MLSKSENVIKSVIFKGFLEKMGIFTLEERLPCLVGCAWLIFELDLLFYWTYMHIVLFYNDLITRK